MVEDSRPLLPQGVGPQAWRLQHHALRQPLNALGLFCAALKMQPLSAAQQPLVAGIADAAQDLERLIDDHFSGLAASPVECWPSSPPSPAGYADLPDAPRADVPAWAEPEDHAPTRALNALAAPVDQDATAPRYRILVVDDDHPARTGLVLLLEAWGASVQAFADIDSLARWLQGPQAARPDLLMLDYHLPRPGDGLVALRLVRMAWPTPPVHALLITGDRQAAMANALSDGSVECLVKPVLPEPLLAALRQRMGAQFGV